MQRHAAGKAKFAPTISFVAKEYCQFSAEIWNRETQTNVTPNWGHNVNIIDPDECIDRVYQVRGKQPADYSESCDVSCAPMPRQREEERQGGQHSNGSKLRMHGVGEIGRDREM